MEEQEQKYNKGIKPAMIDAWAFKEFGVLMRAQQLTMDDEQNNALVV